MIEIPKTLILLSIFLSPVKSIENECKAEFNESIPETSSHYGIDVSWPMHDTKVHEVLGGRQEAYDHFLNGCYGREGKSGCDGYEKMRISMNVRQPQSMRVRFFTEKNLSNPI